jgi:hypothetical protein
MLLVHGVVQQRRLSLGACDAVSELLLQGLLQQGTLRAAIHPQHPSTLMTN